MNIDVETISPIVQSLCGNGQLHGVLSNGIFTPEIYTDTQRSAVDSFFRTNGYLTEKKCAAFGLSRNRIEEFVHASFVSPCEEKPSFMRLRFDMHPYAVFQCHCFHSRMEQC